MRKNKSYTPELKVQIVEDILINNASIRSHAIKHDVDRKVIRQWIKHYKEDGKLYFFEEHRGRHGKTDCKNVDYESMSSEEKIHYLEMENAILKKKPPFLNTGMC